MDFFWYFQLRFRLVGCGEGNKNVHKIYGHIKRNQIQNYCPFKMIKILNVARWRRYYCWWWRFHNMMSIKSCKRDIHVYLDCLLFGRLWNLMECDASQRIVIDSINFVMSWKVATSIVFQFGWTQRQSFLRQVSTVEQLTSNIADNSILELQRRILWFCWALQSLWRNNWLNLSVNEINRNVQI